MNEPGLVIVGSGRSGSGYIARVLTEAGVPCGHEQFWSGDGSRLDGLLADSSWCALAHGLTDFSGVIAHQTRHPLDMVSSMLKEPPPISGPYFELPAAVIRRRMLTVPESPTEFAMAVWLCLNREAETLTSWAWRLEDVDSFLIQRLAATVGVPITPYEADVALRCVPTDYNQHGDGVRLGWDDLPHGQLRDAVIDDAKRWGYE